MRKVYANDKESALAMPVVNGKKKAEIQGLVQALGHASRVTGM